MNKIDLHMHSSMSNDGPFKPEVLTNMCYEAGLKIFAIADHNSTKAYALAKPMADLLKLELIPAIELDCHIEGTNLHVLGHGINPLDSIFSEYENYLATQERETSKIIIQKIHELGIILDDEELEKMR